MPNLILISRRILAGIGIFFGMSALGGFPVGFGLHDGAFLAVSCMSAGIALSCGMWWIFAKNPDYVRGFNVLAVISLCGTGGLALYSNLVFIIWAAGLPMAIGTVANGQMGAHYWLPPATLAYAVLGYFLMKLFAKRQS